MQKSAKNIIYVTNLVQALRDSSVFLSPDSSVVHTDATDKQMYLNPPFSMCSTFNASVVQLVLSEFVFLD